MNELSDRSRTEEAGTDLRRLLVALNPQTKKQKLEMVIVFVFDFCREAGTELL